MKHVLSVLRRDDLTMGETPTVANPPYRVFDLLARISRS